MMRVRAGLLLCMAAFAAPASGAPRKLCGWVQNPTPGNWWLVDRQGDWTIATQGGSEPAGVDKLPEFGPRTWIMTNGNYGYGCGCMMVETTGKGAQRRITRIYSSTVLPLRQCRADRHLPKP